MERLPEFIANHLFLFSLLLSLLILLAWNLFGDSMSGIKAVLPAELTRMINHDNANVVDLRPEQDFRDGHIISSINLPHAEFSGRVSELKKYKDKPLVLYCQTGADSGRAIRVLRHDGFSDVYLLKGGLQAWKNASMPVTKDD
ncbi:MAG: rhodanese-like domain-containing protein [Thiotrichales bacterium]|nr:rhodanese-like domain-containing protein [Thiotrichales bacterium]